MPLTACQSHGQSRELLKNSVNGLKHLVESPGKKT